MIIDISKKIKRRIKREIRRTKKRMNQHPMERKLSGMSLEQRNQYFIHEFVPSRVRLEVSTVCQLRCTGCGFQKGGDDDLGRGFLTFENFKKFCDMNPFVKEIEISNYGEPFLNPHLVDMMVYAKEKGISLICFNGTNFNTVTDEQIRALVDTEFKYISLSIDGASQETYSKYRVGGNFDQVIENVKKLQAYKKEKGSQFPKLRWQYILMEHNELEVAKAKEMAKELGVSIFFKLNWDTSYKPKHREYLLKETNRDFLTSEEYVAQYKRDPFNSLCEQMYIRPQINWDGRLLGCCTNRYAPFDINVFETGLLEAIFSPQYKLSKECLMEVHPDKEKYGTSPCFKCPTRLTREKNEQAFEVKIHRLKKDWALQK